MSHVMEKKGLEITTRCCPSCGSAAREAETTETCDLLTDEATNVLSICVKAQQFADFQQAVARADELGTEDLDIEDPCMNCPHNVVTQTPGTFVNMRGSVGSFVEVHKCDCGTEYGVRV